MQYRKLVRSGNAAHLYFGKGPPAVVVLQFTIVALLIVANGVLSMSELAVVSARTSRLQQMANNGNKGAKTALDLAAQPNRFLSTVQIGITLIGVLTGAFGGATLSKPVSAALSRFPGIGSASDQIGVILVVILITYLSLVIGELVPKRIALQQPEQIAARVAPAMLVISRITTPVVSFLSVSNDFVLRVMGIRHTDEPTVTEEEIRLLLKEGAESGVFEESERMMVTGIFNIADRNAGEIMTPRHVVNYLDLEESADWNRQEMLDHPHTLYPVIRGTLDDVQGIVSSRDLWHRKLSGESTEIIDAMKPALFVPQLAPVLDVTEQMRRQQAPMAVVIDEYGGMIGLLTFNDLISDIIGELDLANPDGHKGAVQRDDGSWLLDGILPAHELRELLEIREIPGEAEGRYETVGGFIMDQLGHIPLAGEKVEVAGHTFEVVDMDGNRVDKVLATALPEEPEEFLD